METLSSGFVSGNVPASHHRGSFFTHGLSFSSKRICCGLAGVGDGRRWGRRPRTPSLLAPVRPSAPLPVRFISPLAHCCRLETAFLPEVSVETLPTYFFCLFLLFVEYPQLKIDHFQICRSMAFHLFTVLGSITTV